MNNINFNKNNNIYNTNNNNFYYNKNNNIYNINNNIQRPKTQESQVLKQDPFRLGFDAEPKRIRFGDRIQS